MPRPWITCCETWRWTDRGGVQPEHAWNHCVVGCNELAVPGKLIYNTISINDTALLRDVLLDDAGLTGIQNMDSLLDRLAERLRCELEQRICSRRRAWEAFRDRAPTPFTSALMHGRVERGLDMHEAMDYDLPTLTERGFTNLVNALASIDWVVFEKRQAALNDVSQAVRAGFRSHAKLRSALLAAPKWGVDDDRADRWTRVWLSLRQRVLREVETQTQSERQLTSHVVRSLHHLEGRGLGATPDGRLTEEPLADGVGAQLGTAFEGPTALLNSVRKLQPSCYWTGGYNLNLTLSTVASGDEGTLDRVTALVDAFVGGGGQELQINCHDASTLRHAMSQPEEHRDLLVRVAGFSARFVDLSPAEQQELVGRAEMMAQCV